MYIHYGLKQYGSGLAYKPITFLDVLNILFVGIRETRVGEIHVVDKIISGAQSD